MRYAYWLAAVILLAGWGVVATRGYLHLSDELKVAQEATKTAQAATKKLQATSVFRETLRTRTLAAEAPTVRALERAVITAHTWAEQPVPQEIQDALAP